MTHKQENRAILFTMVLSAIGLVVQVYFLHHLPDWMHDRAETGVSVAAKFRFCQAITYTCILLSLWVSCVLLARRNAAWRLLLRAHPPLSRPTA